MPLFSCTRSPVHPHRCGENALIFKSSFSRKGSPPQVWGKHNARRQVLGIQRFTPTGVGKTDPIFGEMIREAVHPHRCGENFRRLYDMMKTYGSPPQVWGKLEGLPPMIWNAGFTPTGVGKTFAQFE